MAVFEVVPGMVIGPAVAMVCRMAQNAPKGVFAMSSSSAAFSSVKLPAGLVQQAREAAQPQRRSVAGQIEYWATLGRIAEETGLTVQEARDAISRYDAAARQAMEPNSVDAIEARFLAAQSNGVLAEAVRLSVTDKRNKAPSSRRAA
jgi:hypothetical protein